MSACGDYQALAFVRFSNLEGQRTRMHSRILRHNACSQTDEPNCAPHGRGKKEINPPRFRKLLHTPCESICLHTKGPV